MKGTERLREEYLGRQRYPAGPAVMAHCHCGGEWTTVLAHFRGIGMGARDACPKCGRRGNLKLGELGTRVRR